uniref:glutathione transferase n=1 Tax=Holotrichia parallela TaxID=93412 RepID=A0A8F9WL57_HOLPA|nr:glutathione S-transferase [Holotrichia parallela]
MTSTNIKLTYFNMKSLAETMRYLLKYGNIEFIDSRIDGEEWSALKPNTPFGELPLYEENGKVVSQSVAIIRYLGKKVNLAGADEWEDLEIDALVDTIKDLQIKLIPYAHAKMADNKEKQEELKQIILSETMPYYLKKFESIVIENNGHFIKDKLTWADIYFTTNVDIYNAVLDMDVLEKYPDLLKLKNKVEEIPSIKAWIEVRPETEF